MFINTYYPYRKTCYSCNGLGKIYIETEKTDKCKACGSMKPNGKKYYREESCLTCSGLGTLIDYGRMAYYPNTQPYWFSGYTVTNDNNNTAIQWSYTTNNDDDGLAGALA